MALNKSPWRIGFYQNDYAIEIQVMIRNSSLSQWKRYGSQKVPSLRSSKEKVSSYLNLVYQRTCQKIWWRVLSFWQTPTFIYRDGPLASNHRWRKRENSRFGFPFLKNQKFLKEIRNNLGSFIKADVQAIKEENCALQKFSALMKNLKNSYG